MNKVIVLCGASLILAGCAGGPDTRQSSTWQTPSPSYTQTESEWKPAFGRTDQAGFGASATAAERGTGMGEGRIAAETADEMELLLRSEELVVGKRQVENGAVLIRKIVETERASQPVELRREEFVIERIPAREAPQGAAQPFGEHAFQEREIYIPLMREEAVVDKRAYVNEIVRVRKEIRTDQETVSGTVRRESIDIVENIEQAEPAVGAPGQDIDVGSETMGQSPRSFDQPSEPIERRSLNQPATKEERPLDQPAQPLEDQPAEEEPLVE